VAGSEDWQRKERLAELGAITQETLSVSGILLSKVFERRSDEIERYRRANERLAALQVRQQMTGQGFFALVQTFFGITPAIVYLDLQPHIVDAPDAIALDPAQVQGRVALDSVSAYPQSNPERDPASLDGDRRLALDGLSLEVEPGQHGRRGVVPDSGRGERASVDDARQRAHALGIELAARVAEELPDGVSRLHRLLVGAPAGHRPEGVADRDDAAGHRDPVVG
jgi:hypothetical protein